MVRLPVVATPSLKIFETGWSLARWHSLLFIFFPHFQGVLLQFFEGGHTNDPYTRPSVFQQNFQCHLSLFLQVGGFLLRKLALPFWHGRQASLLLCQLFLLGQ